MDFVGSYPQPYPINSCVSLSIFGWAVKILCRFSFCLNKLLLLLLFSNLYVKPIVDNDFGLIIYGRSASSNANNLLLWKDKVIPKPDIAEDKLAKKEEDILESQKILEKQENDEDNPKKQIKLKKNSLLLLKGRSN